LVEFGTRNGALEEFEVRFNSSGSWIWEVLLEFLVAPLFAIEWGRYGGKYDVFANMGAARKQQVGQILGSVTVIVERDVPMGERGMQGGGLSATHGK